MIARLNVTRFSNEDVIATSFVSPFCAEVGTLHYYTTETGSYDPVADQTTAHGISYVYVAPGKLREQGTTLTMTINGYTEIPANTFFYFDGNGYTICDPQTHGR